MIARGYILTWPDKRIGLIFAVFCLISRHLETEVVVCMEFLNDLCVGQDFADFR